MLNPLFRTRLVLLIGLLLVLVLGACGGGAGEPALRFPGEADPFYPAADTAFHAGEQDTVLAALCTMEHSALQRAFDRLPAYAFTRRMRTEQYARDGGGLRAAEERTVRYRPAAGSFAVLESRSSGTFDSGWMGGLFFSGQESPRLSDRAPHLLPEAPAYRSGRTQAAYAYRLLPDTLLWGRPVQVLDVRLRPEADQQPSLRRARLFVDRASRQLIALRLLRVDGSALFREASLWQARLRPAPDSGWVPSEVRVRTRFDLPLQAPQRLHTVSTYSDYQPSLATARAGKN